MRLKAKTEIKYRDPFYGPIMSKNGNIVSGAPALLIRAAAVGGPSNLLAIGICAAFKISNEAVANNRRKKMRLVD